MKEIEKILDTLVALSAAISAILLLYGYYLWPISFIPPPLSFLNYPSVIAIFLIAITFLVSKAIFKKKMKLLNATILALLYTNSTVWAAELIYHFMFPVYLNYYKPPYISLSTGLYLIAQLILFLPVIYAYKKGFIRITKLSLLCIGTFIIMVAFQILTGFPHFVNGVQTNYYPILLNDYGIFNSELGKLVYGYISKLFFGFFFILILGDKKKIKKHM